MTDTRMRGFNSRAELEEQHAEIHDQTAEVHSDDDQQVDLQDLEREAAWLRKEVLELRSQLQVALGRELADPAERTSGRRYWQWAVGLAFAATLLHWWTQVDQRRAM